MHYCVEFNFRAYDRAAIKFRGVDADINFTIADYEDDMKQVKFLKLIKQSGYIFVFGD